MKILVLGASGRTGSLFTRKALEEGHTVTAYVRNPDKAVALLGAHQNLIIVPGALNDSEQLATISSGQDVMVSILGQKATVREFLSTKFMQKRLPLIMEAVVGAGVPHCVLMSAYGVGDTVRSASFLWRARPLCAVFLGTARRPTLWLLSISRIFRGRCRAGSQMSLVRAGRRWLM